MFLSCRFWFLTKQCFGLLCISRLKVRFWLFFAFHLSIWSLIFTNWSFLNLNIWVYIYNCWVQFQVILSLFFLYDATYVSLFHILNVYMPFIWQDLVEIFNLVFGFFHLFIVLLAKFQTKISFNLLSFVSKCGFCFWAFGFWIEKPIPRGWAESINVWLCKILRRKKCFFFYS